MRHIEEVHPLSYSKRRRTFGVLFFIFAVSLPFLYLYATGYRFDFDEPTNLVGTGGLYVAAERTGAEIYIDGELVRETRVFRRAFYAQNLDPKTHRVHVQKEGHHTWVKELPVTPHRVTEAQAFNLPLSPQVRVVSEWQSATGSAIVRTPLITSSTTNELLSTTTKATSTFLVNTEYRALAAHFSTTTKTDEETLIERFQDTLTATTSNEGVDGEVATTTRELNGVKLSLAEDGLYATWVGSFEQMPYYYCASPFPRYSTSTDAPDTKTEEELAATALLGAEEDSADTSLDDAALDDGIDTLTHPVQTVPEGTVCEPRIKMDTKSQTVRGFDFFPGSTDLVVMELEDGIYVAEIDNRSWQNVQPLILGDALRFYIEGGNIFVYDGALIYQVLFEL